MKTIKFKLILLTSVVLLSCNSSVPLPAPSKVAGVPKKAIWYGGSDGGCWIEVAGVIDNKLYQLNFFNDFTGEKQDSGVFRLCDNCSSITLDSVALVKQISGYDGQSVILSITKNDKNCFLEKR